jgi:hypothetical protein
MAKLSDTSRFKADKGFKGAEGGHSGRGMGRDAPVQFEKDTGRRHYDDDDHRGDSDRKRSRRDDSDDD